MESIGFGSEISISKKSYTVHVLAFGRDVERCPWYAFINTAIYKRDIDLKIWVSFQNKRSEFILTKPFDESVQKYSKLYKCMEKSGLRMLFKLFSL